MCSVHHLTSAPEVFLVDDKIHIIDRVDGVIAIHKVYPAIVLMTFVRRVRKLARASDALFLQAEPRKRKRKKKH
jgi:hypothetical protein